MTFVAVVETPSYLEDAERLLSEAERFAIVESVATNPLQGVLIKGTGGLRKMRIGIGSRGKRGGGRVVYWFHAENHPVVLLALFSKNEASDLTSDERKALSRIADRLLTDFGG